MIRLIGLRVNARVILAWMAAGQIALLVCTLVYLWIRVFYLGDMDAVAALSYSSSEQPPVPVVPWKLGVHTFGDFLLPFEQARVPNPWTDYAMWPNPYPSAIVTLFKLLTNLPYTIALGIFQALSMASMILPVAHGARRFDPLVITGAVCLFVLLSFPFAMVIDRGNAQGLIVIPLYVFSIAWREGRWRPAAIGISIAAAFKLYPALLVVALLAERRFKDAAIAIGTTVAITVFLFALYPGGIISTIKGFLHGINRFSAPTLAGFTTDNYSALGMVANLVPTLAKPPSPSPLLQLLVAHPWVLGISYTLAVATVVNARRLPFVVRLACAISLLSLSIPLSYGYSFAAIVVVVAELLRTASFEGPDADIPLPLAIALGIALTATLAQWPYKTMTGNSIGTVIVPATWIVLTATAIVYRYGPTIRFVKGKPA
jgi:hypothetical protein